MTNKKTQSIIFREAHCQDIPQLHSIRISVFENQLSNPSLITYTDYEDFLTKRGKGWVCEIDNTVVGFAIIDFMQQNIWALFVNPEFERRGIGTKLQEIMLNHYFSENTRKLWLSTASGTRAEKFYINSGWKSAGKNKNGEVLFELRKDEWETRITRIKTNYTN